MSIPVFIHEGLTRALMLLGIKKFGRSFPIKPALHNYLFSHSLCQHYALPSNILPWSNFAPSLSSLRTPFGHMHYHLLSHITLRTLSSTFRTRSRIPFKNPCSNFVPSVSSRLRTPFGHIPSHLFIHSPLPRYI